MTRCRQRKKGTCSAAGETAATAAVPPRRKTRVAALTAGRRTRPTRGDGRPDLVGQDQQHDETVVGVERREVRIAASLDIAVLLNEFGECIEMAAARPHGRTAVGLIT